MWDNQHVRSFKMVLLYKFLKTFSVVTKRLYLYINFIKSTLIYHSMTWRCVSEHMSFMQIKEFCRFSLQAYMITPCLRLNFWKKNLHVRINKGRKTPCLNVTNIWVHLECYYSHCILFLMVFLKLVINKLIILLKFLRPLGHGP